MRLQTIALDEWQCACGARKEEGQDRCAKCRARARWERRTARVRRAARHTAKSAAEQATENGARVLLVVTLLFGLSGS